MVHAPERPEEEVERERDGEAEAELEVEAKRGETAPTGDEKGGQRV